MRSLARSLAHWLVIGVAAALAEICRQGFEKGACRAMFQKWYYDVKQARCTTFVYGGCFGNQNVRLKQAHM